MTRASHSDHETAASDSERPRLLVGVGASADGLDAFEMFLNALPDDSGMVFILTQRGAPSHEGHLADILREYTSMSVVNAEPGATLEPNTVVVIQPDAALAVDRGSLTITEPVLEEGVRRPVDDLFRTLASYGHRAAGVVLSGSGSDGSAGIRELRGAGGLTIAQSPDEAAHGGMPRAAVDAGVDLAVPIDEMPAALERFARLASPPSPTREPPEPAPIAASSSAELEPREEFVEREYRYRKSFDDAAVGITHRALDGRWLRVNQALSDITGYEREELEQLRFHDITHPDDLQPDLENANAVLRGEIDHYSMEKRYIRKDGSAVWVNLTASLFHTPSGDPDAFITVVEDISARKQAERESARLAAIVSRSGDAIVSADADGRVRSWNHAAAVFFGVHSDDAIGSVLVDLLPDELRRVVERVAAGGGGEEARHALMVPRARAPAVPLSVSAFGLQSTEGEGMGVALIARDVTESKRAEEALRRADKQKDEYLAMLGHELRNPLAAIRTAADLMGVAEMGDPRLEKTRDVIVRQTKHMGKLLDGLLDVSRIIRGKISLQRFSLDLVDLVRPVVEETRERVRDDLSIHFEAPEDAVLIDGDAVRLTQVVSNLLSNAVKFTQPPGDVFVTVARSDEGAILQVRDTGRGISPELLPHVFETFRQAEQTVDREPGGLGLGLALVKLLVELHQGSVDVHSNGRGEGATFTVKLPRRGGLGPVRGATPTKSDVEAAPCRILLVEDNRDTADLLSELLAMLGHDTVVAMSGKEALEQVEAFSPEVVVCDIGLPGGMSGLDVARAIRERDGGDAMLLIALSGYGRRRDKEASREAGFDAHLTKPLDVEELDDLLAARDV